MLNKLHGGLHSPWRLWLLVLLVAAVSAGPARAQVLYGSLVGTVEDASGAVVPKATVIATNKATGTSREAASDEGGRYTIPNLLAGSYDVAVKASGFKPLTQQGVDVQVNSVSRVDLRLEVGNLTEQVTVSADAVQLQTDKSDVRSEITTKAVTDLPLPGYRNYQSLLNLVPGTTPAVFQNAVTDTPGRALSTNVNGTARNNNNTRLDGATNVFIWLPHHTVYVAPAETLETVNVSTNAFDAEQGMAGGAAVTVVTKSGTNDLHGVAFAYHDNQRLRSRNYFLAPTQQKPVSTTNIAGGTLSGPIIRNKLFFFGSYEGTFERTGFNQLYTVPTAAERTGNFSGLATTIFDPLTGNALGGGRQAFAGNVIPADRISPVARQVLALIPLPNLPGNANNFTASGTPKLERHNFDGKVNWNRSQNHMIWAKYSHMDALVTCATVFGDGGGSGLCGGGPGLGDTVVKLATLGHTLTLSPTLIVDGNLGWTRMDQAVTTTDYGQNIGLDVLRIPGTNGPDIRQSGFPAFFFDSSPYSSYGTVNGWQPAFRNDYSWTGTTNVSKILGAHELRFGVDVVRHSLNHFQPELDVPRGRFNFTPGVTGNNETGAPSLNQFNTLAGFLLGLPNRVGKSVQNELMTTREWQYGFFARDRWQVTRNLTLNLGLRAEAYPLMRRRDRGIEHYLLATNQLLIGGRGDVPEDARVETDTLLFAPRVGFAYRMGDRTVIRSGYGITYNPMPFSRPLRGFYPLTIAQEFVSANTYIPFAPIQQGIPQIVSPDLSSGVVTPPLTAQVRSPYDKITRGYIQSWNFIVEHKLPLQMVGSVGYVGTNTVNGFGDREINAAGPGGGNAGRPLARAFGRTASTFYWDGFLSANYHSLQTSLNRPFANGLFLKGAYTFSRAINFTDEDGWTGAQTFNWDPIWSRNRALAGYDRTHSFSIGLGYELPFGRGKRFLSDGIGAAVLGGWQINTVTVAYSGTPFNVTADGSRCNCPGNTQTADQVKTDVGRPGRIGPGQLYFDPTAFAPVNEVRFGNTGRNILRGPGFFNSDLSLFRNFTLTERVALRFQAEAYNWTNTPKFNNPNANVSNPTTFMQITATPTNLPYTERQFRFALRLAF